MCHTAATSGLHTEPHGHTLHVVNGLLALLKIQLALTLGGLCEGHCPLSSQPPGLAGMAPWAPGHGASWTLQVPGREKLGCCTSWGTKGRPPSSAPTVAGTRSPPVASSGAPCE